MLLGAVLDAASNASALVSPAVTYAGSAILVIAAVLLHLYLRHRPLPWVAHDGRSIRIAGLGRRPILQVAGAIFLLWLPRIIQPNTSAPTAAAWHVAPPPAPEPASGESDHSLIAAYSGKFCGYNAFQGESSDSAEEESARKLSDFLFDNVGKIVRLKFDICVEAVSFHYSEKHDRYLVDTLRIGDWRVRGLEMTFDSTGNGDILWDPGRAWTYGSFQGYFAILEVMADAPQSEWLLVTARPVRIEDAILRPPNPPAKATRVQAHRLDSSIP